MSLKALFGLLLGEPFATLLLLFMPTSWLPAVVLADAFKKTKKKKIDYKK